MSNNTTDTHVITAVPETNETTELVEKQSFVAKTKAFVKNHKKPAIAVGALVGLVGVSAMAGRKTAPLPGFEATIAIEPPRASFDVDLVESEKDHETA